MRLSELCIRRPVMTTLVMASLLLAGFFGYRQLPIAAIPRIEVPTITVTVQYPGASPDTMAVSVGPPPRRKSPTTAGTPPTPPLTRRGMTRSAWNSELGPTTAGAAWAVRPPPPAAAAPLPAPLPAPPAYRKVNPADSPIIFLALTSD